MKAYFSIPNILTDGTISNPTVKTMLNLDTFLVDGIEQLTTDYFLENPISASNAIVTTSLNAWGYANCTQLGSYPSSTSIDSCSIVGLPNSFNPFAASLKLNYSDTVGGVKRGEIVNTISGNPYGFESFKFGFDKISVPSNPTPSPSNIQGVFYLEFDETKDLKFTINVNTYDLADSQLSFEFYTYEFNATNCSFSATKVEVGVGGNIRTDITNVNFLSGGASGWIVPNCSTPLVGNCDPIVTQSICFLATAPQTPAQIFGDLEGCCYISPVLGHLTENDEWKNDINSFILKRNFASESIDLVLEKNGAIDLPLIDNTYGTYYNFGSLTPYDNYKGYKIEWQKVLQVEGEGNYRLKATSALISGTVIEYSIPFKLQGYTEQRASGTVRLQSIMNGYLRHRDFNFKGLNWVDGLRVRGFFGNRQAEYEQEQIIYTNRQSNQLRSEMINNYTLQTMLIPSCITDTIIEYHNFANTLYITDYNKKNHKDYVQKQVVFDSLENIEYNSVSKYAPLQIKYKDYIQNYTKSNC